MTEAAATTRRPRVLLLAGDVRDAWAAALAPDFEVATTGWLDGITAARLRRPDAVLVSADLPPQATRLVLTAFRSAANLADIPIVVASADGTPPEPLWGNPLFVADRYVPGTVEPAGLVGEVRDAVRAGRVKVRRTRGQKVAVALFAAGMIALGVRIFAEGSVDFGEPPRAGRVSAALLALGITALVAAAAVAVTTFNRRPTQAELRAGLGWAGLLVSQARLLAGREHGRAELVGWSLAFLAWAAWAWLGPRVKPRTPAARRGWYFLAALLALLAVGPWIAYAWIASSR